MIDRIDFIIDLRLDLTEYHLTSKRASFFFNDFSYSLLTPFFPSQKSINQPVNKNLKSDSYKVTLSLDK